MTYNVAVPTYQRAAVVNTHTLPLLINGNVPAATITLFVRDDDPQHDDYIKVAHEHGVTIAASREGLAGAHNAITDHYDEGAAVISVDDDLRAIQRLHGDGLIPFRDIDYLFTAAFQRADREHVTLWGVSPTDNPYFMRNAWQVGLWFTHGALFGTRNTKAHRITVPAKDDYERSLQHYEAAGGVLRLRDVCFKAAPMRRTPGGIQAERDADSRRAAERTAVAMMRERWNGFIRVRPDRDGYPEIALKTPKR